MKIINSVNISGGKDSTATALVALERDADNVEYVFADTGHEHPLTLEYLDYLEEKLEAKIIRVRADFSKQFEKRRAFIRKHWLKDGIPQERVDDVLKHMHPTGNPFLDLCMLKGRFPSTRARFCSEMLKHFPIRMQYVDCHLDAGHGVISWQGIRRDESRGRRNAKKIERYESGYWAFRPIVDWTADMCFAMLKSHGVNPNPLYKLGMGRVGCMPCIHARKFEIREIANRFPEEIERVARWEEAVRKVSKRGMSTFFASDKTPGEGDTRSHIKAVVRWSKTARGGKQFELGADDAPVCSSLYGLCE